MNVSFRYDFGLIGRVRRFFDKGSFFDIIIRYLGFVLEIIEILGINDMDLVIVDY